jgi:hypothetical protein
MSRHTNDLTQKIYDLLISKIDDYKDTVRENNVLFDKLLHLVKSKSEEHSLEVTNQLISRVDDLTEDVLNTNITCKLLIETLNGNTPITLSTREPERTQRIEQWNQFIRENNLLPLLFLYYTNQRNQISQSSN